MTIVDPNIFLRDLFTAALDAVDPAAGVVRNLPEPPRGQTIVLGAGKASAAMAKAVEDHWPGPLEGLVVTQRGYGVATDRIAVVEADTPTPNETTYRAAERTLELARSAGPQDLVLALISGGGSALLTLPAVGLEARETARIHDALKRSAASLTEINTVRRHLSAIKGGRLGLAAAPAPVVSLIVSDISDDDLAAIASGPTVPDPSTAAAARAVLDRYRIERTAAVDAHLADVRSETPKPGDPRFDRNRAIVIASPRMALSAAAAAVRAGGATPVILGHAIQGHAGEIAATQASLALEVVHEREPTAAPRVLLSGGESALTRTTGGSGEGTSNRGGRNGEFLISLALALNGQGGIHAIACDTDGLDGTGEYAGAIIGPDTLARARAAGLDPRGLLANNDTQAFFAALGDLVVTGPTLTNVNDFRAILIL